jgi:hypothetical protein
MENCLTSISKNLIEEIGKLKIRLPFNIDDKFVYLEKYFYKFKEKYSELDNRSIETFNFKKSFNSNKEYNIPCNTIHILRYIWNNKSLLENIYETYSFSDGEIKKTNMFLCNLDEKNYSDCVSWMNINGTKISRAIYNLLKMTKIPDFFAKKMDIPSIEIYGEFASMDIRHSVEKYINSKLLIDIKFRNIKAYLDIKTINEIDKESLLKIVKRCLILAHYQDIDNPIYIEFLKTKNKKVLPKRNTYKLLGPKEINSGSTSFGAETKICIWRDEESNKLILHELIHYHDIDFRHGNNVDNIVSEYFNIAPEIEKRVYEAYTETWANIVNVFICAFECDKKNSLNYAKKMFGNELKYSLYQTAKILNFYGFHNMSEFVRPYDSRKKFKQSTSVFSYFFVKTALLFYIEDFIAFVNKNNDQSFSESIKLSKSPEILQEFLDLINVLCKRKSYLSVLDKLMFKLKNIHKTQKTRKKKSSLPKINNEIKNTLRMTCVEVK